MNKLNWNYGVHICIINNNGFIEKNKYYVIGLVSSNCSEWRVFQNFAARQTVVWIFYDMESHAQKHGLSSPDKAVKLYTRCRRAEQADKTLK